MGDARDSVTTPDPMVVRLDQVRVVPDAEAVTQVRIARWMEPGEHLSDTSSAAVDAPHTEA